TGQQIRVLSGAEEAFWGYQGVKWSFPQLEKPIIMDLGGGSTEFSWTEGENLACVSTKVGAVRMTEKNHTEAEILNLLKPALERIKNWEQPFVAIGGTATTLAAIGLAQKEYLDRQGFRLTLEQIQDIQCQIAGLSLEERKNLPGMSPDRVDIIPAGIRIITLVMQQLHKRELLISNTGLMHGLVLGLDNYWVITNVLTYE
ncbi:MAG: Ppx/GppA family phosphatase, partial [Clostridia bacterium]|nr:Ppx/GppA family phosphatase [Clostridia bacterium]